MTQATEATPTTEATIADGRRARCGECQVEIVELEPGVWLHAMPAPLVPPDPYGRRAAVESWAESLHSYIQRTGTHMARPAVMA